MIGYILIVAICLAIGHYAIQQYVVNGIANIMVQELNSGKIKVVWMMERLVIIDKDNKMTAYHGSMSRRVYKALEKRCSSVSGDGKKCNFKA